MKRDADLIRKILIEIEKSDNPTSVPPIQINGYSSEDINYQIILLDDAGYITSRDASSSGRKVLVPLRMTWAGHEFLDAARDDTVWKKAKTSIGDKISSVSFDVLKDVLIQIAKAAIFPP